MVQVKHNSSVVTKDVSKNVLLKGYLQKLSSGLMASWQTRYFVLYADGRLCYYRKDTDFKEDMEDCSEINLKYYMSVEDTSVIEATKTNVFTLRPKPMDFKYADVREFQFSAETTSDFDMWIGSIYQMIDKYKDLQLKLNNQREITAESAESVTC